jgi:hypothetical protein
MSVRRRPRTMCALLLVSASLVAGPSLGGVAAAARGKAVVASGNSHGNPHAVPPILASATPSELVVIREVEAQEAAASTYLPPASAQYSLAALHRYRRIGR